ncbi:hypothetical protein BTHE68_39990 [Burkholderia sp. THE68]|uniref:helix-turn-helix domain-containing protein n=1 Tax=Burkholderia sp. THE68 TaxID=758782 RepID=UPI0013181CE9|nr:helix-turn-helix domain-containing protein [Burkholderia sp. THE68]BBU30265.1 hypothetical protein BTHE68_39990 [Burkholderia sp. THE68]
MSSKELKSDEVAKMLHVSRNFVETLIAEGSLAGTRVAKDGQHRIPLDAVTAFKREMKMRQKLGLDSMISVSEKASLYEKELKDLPVRRRKR